jgi:hypothetical protein
MNSLFILEWWENLRMLWAFIGLGLALAAGIVLWRARGLLNWKRSQRQELAELKRLRDESEDERQLAFGEVITACEELRRSISPDFDKISELPDYWRRIAACYYPDDAQPELNLSIGQLLAAAQQLADRLEEILQRPGFKRLGHLRIRQLKRTYAWYQGFNAHPVVAWLLARRQAIDSFWHTLRFVLPDPLMWLAYLSQRLVIVMAGRCLLVDLYVFTGKVAIDAFDAQRQAMPTSYGEQASVTVLEAFEMVLKEQSQPMPAELEKIRSELTGLPARLWKPPKFIEWREAVIEAAHTIAAVYFPTSPAPLEEANCRALLDRSRVWLQAMAAARRMPVVRPLYRISLKHLLQIKAIAESDLLRRTGQVASGALTAWRWARWPVKVLRWARRRSPVGAAVDIGFTLARKAVINYLARYGFDRACQELDRVYRQSYESSCPPPLDTADTDAPAESYGVVRQPD